jgi:hypothetical protein
MPEHMPLKTIKPKEKPLLITTLKYKKPPEVIIPMTAAYSPKANFVLYGNLTL